MHPKHMRRLLAVAVALVVLWMFAATATAALNAGSVPTDTHTTSYVVKAGDTEWSIAVRFDQRDDTRDVIDWIERHNRLSGQAIRPGETLIIPIGR